MGQAPPKASAGSQCSICNKGTVVYNCGGCSKDFCYNHLEEHRQTLRQQCSDIKKDCDKFHRQLVEQKKESRKPPFIREVNLWEQESIQKISQTAEECRQILTKQHMRHFTEMEDRLSQLTEELKKIQQENEFNEINIDRIKTQLTKLTGELSELPNVRIQKENTLFIEKFSVVVSPETHQEKKLYQTNLNKNQVKLTEDFNQSPNTSAPIDSDSVSFGKFHETFKIPLTRLRVFYVDDVAFNMGVCGPEELKYPQRLLHTYNIHDGDQFHIDLKPDPPKPQYSNRTVDTTRHNKKSTDSNSTNSSTSSDDDKTNLSVEISPFSLDSLQKLAEEETINNNNINQTSIELDNLYPSTDKNVQIKMNDEDDDLLLAAAAAAACNNNLEFLSNGLEGRSRNPVSLLIDNLIHPDADLGARLQSKIKWRHDPSSSIDHICLGRGGIGGIWNQLTSKHLQTVSMADWMELPNYPFITFRQHLRMHRCRLSTNNEQIITDDENSKRATYDEIRSYYIHYVKRNRLINYFRNGCEVTSIERVCIDASYYDDLTEEIRTPEALWEIRGFEEQTKNLFIIHAKYIVLATGISQEITRPLGIIGEQVSQSFTYTNLHDIEEIIVNKKRLRKNSKPLLVIGCGLTAIDVILLCQQYSIPILHVFRRAIDDHELVLNQLPANIYPEFERIKELIKQSSTITTSTSSDWFYQCCAQSEVISITEDGTVNIRNLRTQIIKDYNISCVVRLTGNEVKIPFLRSLTTKKGPGININPYTYECIDFENIYALGALAGDKLIRFLQGGALACAASLFKKYRQTSSINRLSFNVSSRTRTVQIID
ncbi:unnamed protein product [Rotaria sp. Silwood2]|nr:unnamed protein product [Rotaria sp. Silwood2]